MKKFKITKSEKNLMDAIDELHINAHNIGATLFTIACVGDKCGSVQFDGDGLKLTGGFYNILKCGLSEDGLKNGATKAVSALLGAIRILAEEHCEESDVLAQGLEEIFEEATFTHTPKFATHFEEVEFEVTEEKEERNEAKAESFEELVEKLNKMGYYVSKKPTKKNTKKEDK
jgi:hypothetical protein